MIKRLVNIFLMMMCMQCASYAKSVCGRASVLNIAEINLSAAPSYFSVTDTTKKKIKEIPQAKRQAKPEKLVLTPLDTLGNRGKVKPQRQRRPDGLVRPPEIPRRNN
ncbi:MAG: hypothetical protein ABIN91_07905 [Mucilaginibacter sp.]|uniref:hypothetical protein n=1 Tax=Mucilaginibacter sp. TaxID=1882438 RepID=UPI003265D41B